MLQKVVIFFFSAQAPNVLSSLFALPLLSCCIMLSLVLQRQTVNVKLNR